MSKFKQGYAIVIGLLMVGAFVYLRVSLMLRQPDAVLPESITASSLGTQRIYNVPDLRSANPGFYAKAEEGDIEVTYEDRVLIYRPSTQQIVIERPKP